MLPLDSRSPWRSTGSRGSSTNPRRRRTSVALIERRLFTAFGPQRWWPARAPFEMMVGAILTQATNWRNVERAIAQLRRARALSPLALLALPTSRLERLIRPAGYFRQKARRVQAFARWMVERYGGRADRMFATPWPILRRELLCLHGIGPETADSMLLYGGKQPVFVVDAYTRRVFRRHRLIGPRASYDEIQRLVMRLRPALPGRWPERRAGEATAWYNEFHALLVAVGKQSCHRRQPACRECPLGDLPHVRS